MVLGSVRWLHRQCTKPSLVRRAAEGAWTQPRSLQLLELSSQKRQVAITEQLAPR